MEKEGNYLGNFPTDDRRHQEKTTADYMPNNPTDDHPLSSNFYGSNSFDKLSFADVMQFAEFGPKLTLNQARIGTPNEDDNGIINNIDDPVYFLKFPVLNDTQHHHELLQRDQCDNRDLSLMACDKSLGENDRENGPNLAEVDNNNSKNKSKRKRLRSIKTSEEVESQRMTHIAVERNRRKQMNEHLRVLRSLMPSSYVQRGDQASIIGGAIEFVRELEQLLQCLESQKRRRLYGDSAGQRPANDPSSMQSQPPIMFPPLLAPDFANNYGQLKGKNISVVEYETTGLREETAESKSCLADVEVKVLGFDALIKILSRRRPGQLIKTIAALEDLQMSILHTNITTIEQTVLYSFNVKIGGEARFTAEDMANSVQQIFSLIHASGSI